MKIALAGDHVAVELKKVIAQLLEERGIEYEDFGTHDPNKADYPVYGARAAHAVAVGDCDLGIIMCGTGVGISLAANKVTGIRCVVCSEPYTAVMARMHNDANMLAMGARVVGVELAKMIASEFLDAKFVGGRHQRRVNQLLAIEAGREVTDQVDPGADPVEPGKIIEVVSSQCGCG